MGVLAVAHDPESAALVRHSIAHDLMDVGLDADCVEDIVLVASELVTNALLHTNSAAGADLDITWDLEPNAVVVSMVDTSPTLPIQRSTNGNASSGRGLYIVAALALDWGVRRNERGKQVWARIPTTRPGMSGAIA